LPFNLCGVVFFAFQIPAHGKKILLGIRQLADDLIKWGHLPSPKPPRIILLNDANRSNPPHSPSLHHQIKRQTFKHSTR